MTSVPSLRNISAVVLLVRAKAGGEFTFSLQQGRERVTEIATGRVISGDREVPREIIMERAGRAASGFTALGVAAGDLGTVVIQIAVHECAGSLVVFAGQARSFEVPAQRATNSTDFIRDHCLAVA